MRVHIKIKERNNEYIIRTYNSEENEGIIPNINDKLYFNITDEHHGTYKVVEKLFNFGTMCVAPSCVYIYVKRINKRD